MQGRQSTSIGLTLPRFWPPEIACTSWRCRRRVMMTTINNRSPVGGDNKKNHRHRQHLHSQRCWQRPTSAPAVYSSSSPVGWIQICRCSSQGLVSSLPPVLESALTVKYR